mmetsp:Transcript_13481/g.20263  ORF Transcript_13481/g.20263 Transcript_13481/m.20263 type:complete len:407 (+) Transcript_13481:48-1268(+)|eukprot:CAMPEP_0185024746 /NCGR_PEP_ID=MMETSP1103-20130426/7935_1 /TAXON_ID=36769 /ORGANISM="Paraphysomonas bandaiensis, Strain Caron Lab Isolate" /LENGTH=406 /DNA_ID=CAMNT_0027557799 /DNA_START=44 /DNA_END=1264 /DNA_ORIENTATION=-
MATLTTVKYSYDGVNRRVRKAISLYTGYDDILSTARCIYPNLPSCPVDFIWSDDEGDDIHMSTNFEAQEALRITQTTGSGYLTLRIVCRLFSDNVDRSKYVIEADQLCRDDLLSAIRCANTIRHPKVHSHSRDEYATLLMSEIRKGKHLKKTVPPTIPAPSFKSELAEHVKSRTARLESTVDYCGQCLSIRVLPHSDSTHPSDRVMIIWNIKNTGSVTWPASSRLVCIPLSVNSYVPLVPPGESTLIAVDVSVPRLPESLTFDYRLVSCSSSYSSILSGKVNIECSKFLENVVFRSPSLKSVDSTSSNAYSDTFEQFSPLVLDASTGQLSTSSLPPHSVTNMMEDKLDEKKDWDRVIVRLTEMGFNMDTPSSLQTIKHFISSPANCTDDEIQNLIFHLLEDVSDRK